jgi:hypothetical protein
MFLYAVTEKWNVRDGTADLTSVFSDRSMTQ